MFLLTMKTENSSKLYRRTLEAAEQVGKPAGIGVYGSPLDPTSAIRHMQSGFRLILVGGDEPFLTTSCRHVLDNISSLAD